MNLLFNYKKENYFDYIHLYNMEAKEIIYFITKITKPV